MLANPYPVAASTTVPPPINASGISGEPSEVVAAVEPTVGSLTTATVAGVGTGVRGSAVGGTTAGSGVAVGSIAGSGVGSGVPAGVGVGVVVGVGSGVAVGVGGVVDPAEPELDVVAGTAVAGAAVGFGLFGSGVAVGVGCTRSPQSGATVGPCTITSSRISSVVTAMRTGWPA